MEKSPLDCRCGIIPQGEFYSLAKVLKGRRRKIFFLGVHKNLRDKSSFPCVGKCGNTFCRFEKTVKIRSRLRENREGKADVYSLSHAF